MFEALITNQAKRNGLEIIRIPDGCRQLPNNKLVRVQSPFDFLLIANDGKCAFLDAKSTDKPVFAFSRQTDHQVETLMKCEKRGHWAGYLVLFSSLDTVVFFRASLLTTGLRGSLKPEMGQVLGRELSFDLNLIFKRPENEI